MKYPNGIKKDINTNYIRYDNRGMQLEEDINLSNEYYATNNIAFIYKKPTPIQVTDIEYQRNKILIKKAFFKEASTTDYNGLYKGNYIDFEAKETKSSTSFPLNNIGNHQTKHLRNIVKHGGIAFLIIRFSILNKNYLLKGEDFIYFIDNNERKSIPIDYFIENGHEIEISYQPRLDYLKVVDNVFGGLNEKKENS